MRIKVADASMVDDLIASLTQRVDVIVTRTGDDELEVSLLGSRTVDADADELRRRLEAWGSHAQLIR
jgi:hypothetical protein